MSAKPYWAAILAGVCLLSACQSSPPTHYFALIAVAPTAAPPAPVPAQIPIRVERITIPGELDRLELVRRSTSNRLQIATFDRWAAPLDDMIRRVVAADLAARLAPWDGSECERARGRGTAPPSLHRHPAICRRRARRGQTASRVARANAKRCEPPRH